MKFEADREALFAAVKKARAVIGAGIQHIQILRHIRLSVEGGELTVTATDLDRWMTVAVPVKDAKIGAACVDAAALAAALAGANDTVSAVLDKGTVTLTHGSARYKLNTLPADDFPVSQPMEEGVSFTMTAADLSAAIGRVSAAASNDPSRPAMGGLCIRKSRLCATDGHQLASTPFAAPEDLPETLIPNVSVPALSSMGEGDVAISADASRLIAKCGSAVFTTKLLGDRFPEMFERVTPDLVSEPVVVNRRALTDALRRVSAIVANNKMRAVMFTVTDGQVVLAAKGDAGTARDAVACESPNEHEFAMETRVLAEVIDMAGSEMVALHIHDPATAIRIAAVGDPDWIGVVMPWRMEKFAA